MDSIRVHGRTWCGCNGMKAKTLVSQAGQPWLVVNQTIKEINVPRSTNQSDSIFYTYQKRFQIRKENSWLIRADFELLDTVTRSLLISVRTNEHQLLSCNCCPMKNKTFQWRKVKNLSWLKTLRLRSSWKTGLGSMGCLLCGTAD